MTEQNKIKVQGELANKTGSRAVSDKHCKEKILMMAV